MKAMKGTNGAITVGSVMMLGAFAWSCGGGSEQSPEQTGELHHETFAQPFERAPSARRPRHCEGRRAHRCGRSAVAVEPATTTLGVSETQQLEVVGGKRASSRVAWSSDHPDVASVNADGLVTGVAAGVATIHVTTPRGRGSAEVEVVDNTGFAIELRPLLVELDEPEDVRVLVDALPGTTSVDLVRPDGSTLALARVGDTTRFELTLTSEQALASYVNDPQSQALGFSFLGDLHVTGSATPDKQLFVQVLAAEPAPVPIIRVNADMQRSPHIVNIRDGRLFTNAGFPPIIQKFYEEFPDDLDFLAVSWAAADHGNVSFTNIRNATEGIGLPPLDFSARFGASGTTRLQGAIHLMDVFDLAHQVLSHEIGHSCMNYLSATPLVGIGGHWPVSTAAFGVMGVSSPIGPVALAPLGNGDFIVEMTSAARDFNDLELYLLGLGPASAVADQLVFPDQSAPISVAGTVLKGPATVVSMNDIIATYGPRSPAYPEAQKDFRLATIVVTRAGLMTDEEMAWFDERAARGEARTSFGDLLRPWYVSTSGRSTLSTTIPPLHHCGRK